MKELSVEEAELIRGAVAWDEVGAGLGAVALGVAIATTPVGWVGAAGAAAFSYAGGVAIGNGLINGSAFKSGDK